MSRSYAPLPNPRSDRDPRQEMEAAFDDSGDEDDFNDASESHPLNPQSTSPVTHSSTQGNPPLTYSHSHNATIARQVPGTYDFENVDYDYPPPGSPPPPSAFAQPNDIGNSNGQIPDFELGAANKPRRAWFRRTLAAALPTSVAQRLGIVPQRPTGAIGGGTNNDGVFANVTAKPTAPRQAQDGDDAYASAEDARADAPPSYASAQADAVPPYWETTVHAPFAPDSMGEMIIDNLPTGSLFSFLWNMLVSISFQFVGFLLTYLLHTTHAARLGSRAGLGVTLIQYGFALRNRAGDGFGEEWTGWDGTSPTPMPTGEYGYRGGNGVVGSNSTSLPAPTEEEQVTALVANATTEWLSFFLMTIGWFILLTSLLGFWRVKRWERGILNSQRDSGAVAASEPRESRFPLFPYFGRHFGLSGFERVDLLRRGFGLGRSREPQEVDEEAEVVAAYQARRAEEGGTPRYPRHGEDGNRENADDDEPTEQDLMIPIDPNSTDRESFLRSAMERDRRLQADLREAGLI